MFSPVPPMISRPSLPQPVVLPLMSVRRIVIPSAVPTKFASGINSTSTFAPLSVILYLPCPGTT